ncbi:hypothetical protein R1flu_024665 [Riccia fluitans]|uniref:Uncharacterized protein n=1 Tax=Riccia fluitans TaxID=41844 RepID=A0ABD1XZM7_9MARC
MDSLSDLFTASFCAIGYHPSLFSPENKAHQIVLAAQAMSSIETDQSGMTFHKKEVGICNVTIELQLLQLYFDSLQEWPPSPEFQDPA